MIELSESARKELDAFFADKKKGSHSGIYDRRLRRAALGTGSGRA